MSDLKVETKDEVEAEVLFDLILPLLSGNPFGVQGEALAKLLAICLAVPIREPELREDLTTTHVARVRELIPYYERIVSDHLLTRSVP
jgi:hypothetical protein